MCLPYVSEMSPVRPPNLPYIDEMRAADKPLRLTPAFNVLFLRRSMYFSSHACTFNRLKHRWRIKLTNVRTVNGIRQDSNAT